MKILCNLLNKRLEKWMWKFWLLMIFQDLNQASLSNSFQKSVNHNPEQHNWNGKKMTRLITTKRLTFAIIMGTFALVMQATVPGIPLGVAGAKLELADIPAVIGSSIGGPVGGIICGLLFGVMRTANLALIP